MTRSTQRCAWCVVAAWLFVAAQGAAAVEVVCHRGANEVAPENTRAAAQKCIDWGVAYVEIDVRTSQDGVFYILHDPTVDRTTNGKGRLRDLTSDQIDKLDAGSWFDAKFAGERVPRLDEYLKWIKGKAKIYFDVKDADLAKLIGLVHEVGIDKDCFFWFGNPLDARKFRELNKDLALKVNVSNARDVERATTLYGANIVEVSLKNMNQELVDACQERGIKIMVYHPQKDAEAFKKIVELKADMVNLNHGDLFLEIERQFAKQN